MKIDFVLADPTYTARPEQERLAHDYGPFSKDNVAEMVDMCGDQLNFGGHAHIYCSSVQCSSLITAVLDPTAHITFQYSKGNERLRIDALLDREKQVLAYLRIR